MASLIPLDPQEQQSSKVRRLEGPEGYSFSPRDPRAVDVVREQAPVPGPLKGCRDCTYQRGVHCHHPSFGSKFLNTFTGGIETHRLPKWSDMRQESGPCGPEARLWSKVKVSENYRTYKWLAVAGFVSVPTVTLLFSLWGLLLIIPTIVMALLSAGLGVEE